jgi:energy-coupling factor transporter ATP-binding protein EcfA2
MPRGDMEISRIEKSINVDEIVSRMHSYEIRGEHVSWRFVDRKGEVESILGRVGVVEGGRITVLYGPKGCGKSTLFNVLASAADQAGAGPDIMVIERPEDAVQMAVLSLPRSFRDLARSIAGYVAEGFKISSTGPLIEFASTPTYIVWKIAEYIAHRLRRGRKILIVLDEVRADSQEHLSIFRQWLENFANDIKKYNRDYSEKGGSIAVIALTSDALVREIRHVVGGKVSWALIWNLSRVSSEELASQIELHNRVVRELGVDSEKAGETLWRLAGGKPRALELIWGEGLRRWLEGEVINGIKGFVQHLPKKQKRKALEEISASLDKVDDIGWTDPGIWKPMLRHNVIIYVAAADKISEIPREQWIGREYAFQIPAYYYALKAMARKRSWDISPEEVIREAMD